MEFLGAFVRSELQDVDGIAEPLIADFSMNDMRDLGICSIGAVRLVLDLPEERLHLFAG